MVHCNIPAIQVAITVKLYNILTSLAESNLSSRNPNFFNISMFFHEFGSIKLMKIIQMQ
jgi:hypothetical protein